ncbi:VOC family protein [Phytoactinopolyspora mesophila]|uniref:VOC family protein n=1 Tax=Phytoactinopolyspora mesophila TaxID=2650750 RepID=A0A7K3MBC7_9ACTN|nr:VOC family protein [Phytoactinopolyspora mesophila]NDL60603.1 VOC family protein [Phytoactinopolyspora mesophila]
MPVHWLVAFIDRPEASFAAATDFWLEVTGSTLSSFRGEHKEFATILPPEGDAYLRVQRVTDGPGGSHLDLLVDDMTAMAAHAQRLGARPVRELADVIVMHSPAGFAFCLASHNAESSRPGPVSLGAGPHTIVDQLCIDVPRTRFESECAFWTELTGWPLRPGSRPEFSYLERPPAMPLRLLLQRTDIAAPGARALAHLDLACDDATAAAAVHEELGAEVLARHEHWITMKDPAGVAYCLTRRNPDTGRLTSP